MMGSSIVETGRRSGAVVWYFSYGSNMSREKLEGSRGIHPIAKAAVSIIGWQLTFNIPGIPYKEPVFTSVTPKAYFGYHGIPDVNGIAYLISSEDYAKIVASEGGGVAYSNIELECKALGQTGLATPKTVRTFGSAVQRNCTSKPSARYLVSSPLQRQPKN